MTGKYRSVLRESDKDVSMISANPILRVLAYVIDAAIVRFSFQGLVVLLGYFGAVSEGLAGDVHLYLGEGLAPIRGRIADFMFITSIRDLQIHLVLSIYFLVYFIVLESKHGWGRTIGKKITGMKVLDRDGDKISLKKSVIRNSTKYLLRLPIIGMLLGLFEAVLIFLYSTRTGDILADTIVASKSQKGGFGDDEEKYR